MFNSQLVQFIFFAYKLRIVHVFLIFAHLSYIWRTESIVVNVRTRSNEAELQSIIILTN